MVDSVSQFDLLDIFFGNFSALAEVSAAINHGEFHIFQNGHLRKEIEILKYKAYLNVASMG